MLYDCIYTGVGTLRTGEQAVSGWAPCRLHTRTTFGIPDQGTWSEEQIHFLVRRFLFGTSMLMLGWTPSRPSQEWWRYTLDPLPCAE